MTDPAAYLRIEGLTKRFGEFTALDDISLEVVQGEFVCFLGPSGCGKTTLLRAIAGLDIQSAGRVLQGGQDISTLPPSQRDFGIVFQSYALFPNMTVARNVAYGLESQRTLRRDAIRARVRELLELVGLPEQGDKFPAQLSGGQQQRVALARAIATSPGLLLLDEPLSALDAQVRTRLRGEVKDLQRRLGVTTVMVTHDQEEALTMADRIVVMNHGVIEQVGTPEAVYGEPATAFVADFMGTMNFLPARASSAGVSLGGVELRCAHDARDGDAVTVAVRPEDLILDATPDSHANRWQVRVVSLEFLGSFVRATLAFGEGQSTIELLADVSINLVRRIALAAGQVHHVALPDERIRVYRERVGNG